MERSTNLLASGGALSALFLVLAACGGWGSPDDSGSGGGSGACAQYVNALVGYADRCGDGVAGGFEHERARFEASCQRALAAPGAAPNLPAQVLACAQAISAGSCSAGTDDACKLTGGTLEDGAPCGEGFQCKSGACKTAPGGQCGTCSPRVAVGGDCTSSAQCVDGAECQLGAGDSGTCVTVKIAKAGESCASDSGELVRCEPGTDCSFGSSEPTCKTPSPAGADCTSGGDCEGTLKCVAGKCSTGLGEGAECQFGECAKGLACGNDKKCARIAIVKTGEECDDLVRRCERGTCNGSQITSGTDGQLQATPGRCVDPLPDGAACTDRNEDEDAASCDSLAECIGGKCTVADPAQCK